MKRISLLIFALLILITVAAFIPFNNTDAVKVNSSYFNCYQQLTNAESWKKWQPAIKTAVNNSAAKYTVTHNADGFKIKISGGTFFVKQQYSVNLLVSSRLNNDSFDYSYTLVPDTAGLSTTIMVSFKTNAFKYFIAQLNENELKKTSIYDFKRYMEDPLSFYGFDIMPVNLPEKNIVVKSKTIPANTIFSEALDLQNQLHSYILQKHLTPQAETMVQFITKSKDSLQMLVGIPVNSAFKADQGFAFMHIPATRALTADYNGRYSSKLKIYNAVQGYFQDKLLHPKIAPLEIFREKFPVKVADSVRFKLIYPIF
jgi:hypothetical protein